MICFGPHPTSGTNILVAQQVKSQYSFIKRVVNDTFENEDEDEDWNLDEKVIKMLD